MKSQDLTIVVPVKTKKLDQRFIDMNKDYFDKFPLIVIDSGGGEGLMPFADKYYQLDYGLFEARRVGYLEAKTRFVLNLDSDVLIPLYYPEISILTLDKEKDVGAISIFFQEIGNRGSLEFGISVWRKDLLLKLHDFEYGKEPGYCECSYMWNRLFITGHRLLALNMRAIHLGEK